MTCPECGHQQKESRQAISTICRGCNAGYEIKEGAAVSKKFNRVHFSPKANHTLDKTSANQTEVEFKNPHRFPFHGKAQSPATPISLLQKYLHRTPEKRAVVCIECNKEHSASSNAQSSHCPSCGSYVSLRDYEIKENWHLRIQTRGNVHIHKKGSVQGIIIQCHNLTVEGIFHGSEQCSGFIIFQHSAKILGRLSCQQLTVPKGCVLESQHPITTHDALIEGELISAIIATGTVTIEKKAVVIGDVTAANIVIQPGAKQQGMITINQVPR